MHQDLYDVFVQRRSRAELVMNRAVGQGIRTGRVTRPMGLPYGEVGYHRAILP